MYPRLGVGDPWATQYGVFYCLSFSAYHISARSGSKEVFTTTMRECEPFKAHLQVFDRIKWGFDFICVVFYVLCKMRVVQKSKTVKQNLFEMVQK